MFCYVCSKREIKFATDHLTKNAEVFFRTPFRENYPMYEFMIFKIKIHLLLKLFYFVIFFEAMIFFVEGLIESQIGVFALILLEIFHKVSFISLFQIIIHLIHLLN